IYEHCYDPEHQKQLAQTIIDIMHKRALVDFTLPYFSESYAAEIISLELQYSLLREIISKQVIYERNYIKYLYRNFSPNRDFKGYPENLVDDPRLLVNLFPGSSKTSCLDFYTSCWELHKLPNIIADCVNDIIKAFNVKNVSTRILINRTILQEAIVEWKLLNEEDKIQKQLKSKLSEESHEDYLILEDFEELLFIAEELK